MATKRGWNSPSRDEATKTKQNLPFSVHVLGRAFDINISLTVRSTIIQGISISARREQRIKNTRAYTLEKHDEKFSNEGRSPLNYSEIRSYLVIFGRSSKSHIFPVLPFIDSFTGGSQILSALEFEYFSDLQFKNFRIVALRVWPTYFA